jgi:two-component system, OmpR family, sensor histidine kinase QseC
MNLRPSLFRHLLTWALAALVVVWATFMFFGYRTGVHEADELTDGHLASVASLLLSQNVSELKPAPAAAQLGGRAELKAHDYQQSLSIVIWDAAGRVLSRSGQAITPPFSVGEGFETLVLGQPGAPWRAFSRWNGPDHARKITVLLSLAERDELAKDIAGQVAEPGFWLLPVVALMLALAIRTGLRPLVNLSAQVHRLDIHRDTALNAPPHQEFKAVVQSINTLIARYNAALARERELASEVAHELRTPLASLKIHAASLRHELSADERTQAMKRIELDAERAGAVLSDLLALARASRAELAEAEQTLDLAELARRVASEFGQAAFESGHQLSVEAPEACAVTGHPGLLELALRNLVENALTHTPRATTVRIGVANDPPTLEVCDNGGAIASGQVTAPARPRGLGLGHQVVRRVASVHNGRFETDKTAAAGARTYRIVLGPVKAA